MREKGMRFLLAGILATGLFFIWTALVLTVDVQRIGQAEMETGFATINMWFHNLTGVHMTIYTVTDWLGLVPIFIGMMFGGIGLMQLIRRKRLLKVDRDIILLGAYYFVVIAAYLVFEMIPINYRPVMIDGRVEASYPSSTTLLVLSVMPTLVFQIDRRLKNAAAKKIMRTIANIFSALMVVGRLVSGVHWLTDIVGSVLLSMGLFFIYKAAVLLQCDKDYGEGRRWSSAKSYRN